MTGLMMTGVGVLGAVVVGGLGFGIKKLVDENRLTDQAKAAGKTSKEEIAAFKQAAKDAAKQAKQEQKAADTEATKTEPKASKTEVKEPSAWQRRWKGVKECLVGAPANLRAWWKEEVYTAHWHWITDRIEPKGVAQLVSWQLSVATVLSFGVVAIGLALGGAYAVIGGGALALLAVLFGSGYFATEGF